MLLLKAFALLFPALAAASAISSRRPAGDVSRAQEIIEPVSSQTVPIVDGPEDVSSPTSILEEHSLELRQAITPGAAPAAATTAAKQQSPVTTEWIPSAVNPSSTPYVEVVYTQTFAAVPSQLPSAASGEVGLGTITGQVGVLHTTTAEKDNGVTRVKAGMGSLRIMLGVAALCWLL